MRLFWINGAGPKPKDTSSVREMEKGKTQTQRGRRQDVNAEVDLGAMPSGALGSPEMARGKALFPLEPPGGMRPC